MVQGAGGTTLQLGQAVLDLDRGTLTIDGQVVPLRAKSFRLLCELARQPGRVVSKDELLDAVWPDVIVTDASLSQAVRDVRKALNDLTGQILRTVARRGFMLCPTRPLAEAGHDRPADHILTSALPRIALLPVTDRTNLPDQGPLLDGLVEEITMGLARFRNLTVVARHSAFAAASDRSLGLAEVGAKLKTDYIVDGAARLMDGRLVLALALNDVRSGDMLWGESFLCQGTGWLTLQDLIPRRIVQRLFTSIEMAGHQRSLRQHAASLTAFEHLARGLALYRSMAPDISDTLTQFAAAIEADPSLGIAHSHYALLDVAAHGFDLAPPEVKRRAREQALRGVQLSPEESRCHGILSFLLLWEREFDQAEQAARRGFELNPCDADSVFSIALVLMNRGNPQESLAWFERAKDINPLWPPYYDIEHSLALFLLDHHEEAVQTLSRIPRRSGRQEMRLAASYALMGQRDLAKRHAERAQSLAPGQDFVELARIGYPFEHDRDRQHLIGGIKLALKMSKEE